MAHFLLVKICTGFLLPPLHTDVIKIHIYHVLGIIDELAFWQISKVSVMF